MMAVQHMFDTLQYANQLKAAGVDAKQAEAHAMAQATVFAELIETKLATKDDIKELRHEMHDQIRDLDVRVQGIEVRMQGVEVHLQGIENRLFIKLSSVMVTGISMLAALITLMH